MKIFYFLAIPLIAGVWCGIALANKKNEENYKKFKKKLYNAVKRNEVTDFIKEIIREKKHGKKYTDFFDEY